MPHHKHYTKIHRIGHAETVEFFNFDDEVFVEEKVDGANFQFSLVGTPTPGTDLPIRYGSRNRPVDRGNNQWLATIEAIETALTGKVSALNPNYIYFLEAMKAHTIQYDWDNTPSILGIDIYDIETCQYIHYDKKIINFKALGIETVPLVWRGALSDINVKEIQKMIPKSKYYDGEAEGIVAKIYDRVNRYGRALFVKVVTEDFAEKNSEWHKKQRKGKKLLPVVPPHQQVVAEYATPARIRKCALKIATEKSVDIGMEMIGDLIKLVSEDILTEEIVTIMYEHNHLDFKNLRSCLALSIKKEIVQFMLDRTLDAEKRRER